MSGDLQDTIQAHFDTVLSTGKFDSIDIQPNVNNFGTVTNQTRPTLMEFNLNSAFTEETPTTPIKNADQCGHNSEALSQLKDMDSNTEYKGKMKSNKKSDKDKFGMFNGVLARCLLCIWYDIL